jgi:hypothetical protein
LFTTSAAFALWAAVLLFVAQPAAAAPPASNEMFLVSVASGGRLTVTPTDATRLDTSPSETVVLPGETRTGVATNIVCNVHGWGPQLDNQTVFFEILLLCEGGVPMLLDASLDIYHVNMSAWEVAPGSHTRCGSMNSPVLDQCVARTPCWKAGNYYYGYAHLIARDDEGALHEADVYTYTTWIGCIV